MDFLFQQFQLLIMFITFLSHNFDLIYNDSLELFTLIQIQKDAVPVFVYFYLYICLKYLYLYILYMNNWIYESIQLYSVFSDDQRAFSHNIMLLFKK